MAARQGDLALLDDPVAQALLHAPIPARLAYTWLDGTPRVVPIWFHWDGEAFTMSSPRAAPKLRALAARPHVALTIDGITWPYKVLLVRGTAVVTPLERPSPQYTAAARRYFGEAQGRAWVAQIGDLPAAQITVRPAWVGLLDFETRFPSALSS